MPDFTDSVWMRPARTRSDQPTPSLSRAQIVRAAIELLDAEGAAGLSMRRLGSHLGSGATSVYWHVANKDELLELAVDETFAEVYVPEPGDTPWRIGASVMANGMRQTLLRHPWVIGTLGIRPTMGPNAMRFGERMVALLTGAGFTGIELSHASSLLTSHAIGSATAQSAVTASMRRSGLPIDEIAKKIEPYLTEKAADYPHYDKWRRDNNVLVVEPNQLLTEAFDFGLECILDGLDLWLSRNPTKNPAP
ncbi:MAG TPA: TetR/AcrR family transcriptional regulator [Actinoplanes sp.]